MVAKIGCTILFLEPWNAPAALGRAWVLLELFNTIASGADLRITMPAAQRVSFEEALLTGLFSVCGPIQAVDLRLAEAYKERDRKAIFAEVRELPGGFAGLNRDVRAALGEWVRLETTAVGEAATERCGGADTSDSAVAMRSATSAATMMAWRRKSVVGDVSNTAVLAAAMLLTKALSARQAAAGPTAAPASTLARMKTLTTIPRTEVEAMYFSAELCRDLLMFFGELPAVPNALMSLVGGPLECAAELCDSARRFLAGTRAMLHRLVHEWVKDGTGGIFAVLAGPGFGKTAFAASVCAAQVGALVAVHLCRSDDGESRNPVAFVRSLAAQLVQSLPGYGAALAGRLGALRAKADDPNATALSLLARRAIQWSRSDHSNRWSDVFQEYARSNKRKLWTKLISRTAVAEE